MKLRPRPSVVLYALILLSGGLAQTVFAMPTAPMHFSHITLDDGLSQNNVQAIYQDSRGYMWFATESGLNRFDGYEIRVYSRERGNPRALGKDFIWAIGEDAAGDLWMATQGGGLVRWNRASDDFDSFRHDPADRGTLASDDIRTLVINDDGTIWVGTRDRGIDLFDPTTGKSRHFGHDPENPASLSNDTLFALLVDSEGFLWAGTDAGLNRLARGSDEFERFGHDPDNPRGLSDGRIRSIFQDRSGTIWVGTFAGGLNRFDAGAGTFSHLRHDAADAGSLSHNHVRVIFEDNAGRLWIGTADGLNHLDREEMTLHRYRHDPANPQSLNDSYINSLFQDRSGVLWVGTRSAGLSKWNPRSWLFGHYVEPWLSDADVTSFATDDAGNLWIGTLGGGLAYMDADTFSVRRFRHDPAVAGSISDDRVMSLELDAGGVLWIGTMSAGLDRMDTTTYEIRNFRHDPADPASLAADGVMTLFEGAQGDLWIGTYGGGVSVLDKDSGQMRRYASDPDESRSLSDGRASAILQDADGAMWIGTFGNGLNRMAPGAGTFERFLHNPDDPQSLSDNTIFDLHLDINGNVWVGTAGGGLDRVIRLPNGGVRFENTSQHDGLPSNVIYSVLSDASNQLWLSTNYGIAKIDPGDSSIQTFHSGHGLQGEEFNFGAHHMSADGVMYFGGANGFNAFRPERLETGGFSPEIVLTSLEKSHQPAYSEVPYDLLDDVALDYRDDVVTFEYAALEFTAPLQNRYAYMLEGFDADWVDAGTRRSVTYTNLDAGDYVFRVKAASSDGTWAESGLSLPVSVSAAPWRTTAAYVLYAGAALMLLWLASSAHRRKLQREAEYRRKLEQEVASRTRELRKSNRDLEIASRAKSDFLARMSHEIRTPMNGMLGMTELMMGTVLDDKQRRFAKTIKRSAESLLEIINDILDFSKIEAGRLELDRLEFDVSELVEETVELFSVPAAEKGIELLCSTPAGRSVNAIGDPVRLKQIVVNLLSNAIKFTQEGEVMLSYAITADGPRKMFLRFEVSDTGVGIREESQNMIFDSFSQEDDSTTRRFGGTGLGLAICKQLVHMMGGEIGVESTLKQGSKFWFTLDLDKVVSRWPARGGSYRLANLHVLVVDDSRANVQIVNNYLTALGVHVDGVNTGYDALKCLDAAADKAPYDVVLLDYDAGDMRGVEIARAVRANEKLANTKLVLLTPVAGDADVSEWRSAGIDTCLQKPLRQMSLYEILLMLTADADALQEPRPLPAEVEPTGFVPLKGLVLLAEDNPVNQAVAQGMLAELGCDVVVAANGEDAVIKSESMRFDAILMDCEMPVMDGFKATEAIRERANGHGSPPIIALTANAIEGDRERCLAAGMDDYVSKPVTMESLHAALSKWMENNMDEPMKYVPPIDGSALDNIRNLKGIGGERMVNKVISLYLTNSMVLADNLREGLLTRNAEAVRQGAHALKSSSQNVGAAALAEFSRRLEEIGRAGQIPETDEYLGELNSLYKLSVQALKAEIRSGHGA